MKRSLPFFATIIAASVLVTGLARTMFSAPGPVPQGAARTPIKAMFITGGCCHDYATQMRVITEGVSKFANVQWTLHQSGGTGMDYVNPLFDDPNWAKDVDVVLHDPCFANTKNEAYIRKILAPHKEGKPAIVLHCAMHTYRDAPNADEWREFLGVTTHEHEPATRLEIKSLPAQAKHPIMTGFPEVFTPPVNDEMYIILKTWPNTTPLATGYGIRNNTNFPAIWTNLYGEKKAKVFGTTLGHATQVIQTETYLNLVARGLLWTVDKLDEKGGPVAGYEPAK